MCKSSNNVCTWPLLEHARGEDRAGHLAGEGQGRPGQGARPRVEGGVAQQRVLQQVLRLRETLDRIYISKDISGGSDRLLLAMKNAVTCSILLSCASVSESRSCGLGDRDL